MNALTCLIAALLAVLPQETDRDAALQQKVNALSSKVGATLGVELKAKVPAAYQTREEFAKILKDRLEKEFPPEEQKAVTTLYRQLGLFPEDFDLAATLVETMKSQAGAYYDPESKKMYVLQGEMKDDMLETVLFHELVHAAQDQEHDLHGTMKKLEDGDNSDRALAYRFLVEGEATFWMNLQALKKMGMEPMLKQACSMTRGFNTKDILNLVNMQAAMQGGTAKEAAEQIKKIPPVLVRSLMDPYLRGGYAAYLMHEKKGRDEFRRRFREAHPACTRDMMFPDDFLESPPPPGKVAIADLQKILGDAWKKTHEDTAGAITFHTMFEDQKPQADAVAKGWGGDRLQLWQSGDKTLVTAVAVFTSKESAGTFGKQLERAYREHWTKGKDIKEHPGDATHLESEGDHLLVEVRDATVLFCRGTLPVTAEKLLGALRESKIELAAPAVKD